MYPGSGRGPGRPPTDLKLHSKTRHRDLSARIKRNSRGWVRRGGTGRPRSRPEGAGSPERIREASLLDLEYTPARCYSEGAHQA